MKKIGRPVDADAIKLVKTLEKEHPTLTNRQLALLVKEKLKRDKIDPKSIWRWRKAVI